MKKAKIFIASSGRALILAERLKEALWTDFSEAIIWSEESKGKPSNTIIEMLEDASQNYDFAIIILTQDDMISKKDDNKEQLKARDNCIFEAGLFMGVLGRKRCFLVSSLETGNLPVDFSGIIYIHLVEPTELNNYVKCREAIAAPSAEIKESVQIEWGKEREKKQKLAIPHLSATELLERERLADGDLEEGQVVISAAQPLDTSKYECAIQVKQNLDGGVKYIYFLHASEDGAQKICWLLQNIVLVGLIDPDNAKSFKNRCRAIEAQGDEVINRMEDIKDKLNIYFLAKSPSFQFCIHNANSNSKAKAYVKFNEDYIEWAEGNKAYQIWDDIKKCTPPNQPGVFLPTICVNINQFDGGKFKNSLDAQLKRHFPGIYEKVMKICYGQ